MKAIFALLIITASFFAGILFIRVTECGAGCGKGLKTVLASEFFKQLTDPSAMVIDVRTAEEYSQGHIKGSVNQDFKNTQTFINFLDSLNKRKKYLVYCRSGNRSTQAMQLMEEKGFTHVINLSGGILAWQEKGYPLTKN